jgi:hypothetical protein
MLQHPFDGQPHQIGARQTDLGRQLGELLPLLGRHFQIEARAFHTATIRLAAVGSTYRPEHNPRGRRGGTTGGYAPAMLLPEFGQLGQGLAGPGPNLSRFGRLDQRDARAD